jgi:hypothetical protein
MFEKIPYANLNSRQKENYNFHKVAARLADYGFNALRLTDLKVQLKSRLGVYRKYRGKGIYIAFILGDAIYLYDHDQLVAYLKNNGLIGDDSVTWHEKGFRHWPKPPAWATEFLEEFRI